MWKLYTLKLQKLLEGKDSEQTTSDKKGLDAFFGISDKHYTKMQA